MKPKKRSNMLWKNRKLLIQEATGTLSDDELDYDIKDEEEWEMRYV